jgi:hypothetical protein
MCTHYAQKTNMKKELSLKDNMWQEKNKEFFSFSLNATTINK